MITSRSSPLIKKYRKTASRLPDGSRKVVIEGLRLLTEARESGAIFEALFFTQAALKSTAIKDFVGETERKIASFDSVSSEVMEALSLEESPPGLWAVVEVPQKSPLVSGARILILCGIQDPGNAGNLIRTAEGAGASVWFSEKSVHPFHPKVVKASMGSVFRVPAERGAVVPLLRRLKKEGWSLVAAKSAGGLPYTDWKWELPFALLLGAEAHGLPQDVEQLAEVEITIPLKGNVESLNVASAGAILLFEACRRERVEV